MTAFAQPRPRRVLALIAGLASLALICASCSRSDAALERPHGPIAEGISAPLGDPLPTADADQLEAFTAGREVARHRFAISEGLGPAFNVTFCAACHERPETGGSAALYRNFFLAGTALPDGSFVPAESAGKAGGVIRMYGYGDLPARPDIQEGLNAIAQRNPIPMFGVGLIAELSGEEILSREDPDDADGDGISGRANFDQGFVGRFGRKAQTVSIEGFLRGPLFNHLGITTDPLSEEQRAALPVDSSLNSAVTAAAASLDGLAQAAAPAGPTTDADGIPDPELSPDDLFDLVSFSMLLAAPQFEEPTAQSVRGAAVFDRLECGSCHTPRLQGPRGPLAVYSDLLLHDMGPDLADGIVQGSASGSEFRTQPLWGIAPAGPYLHDGRAATLGEAILMHDGEAERARRRAAALSEDEMADLIEFLMSLGGRDQMSTGLLPPDEPLAAVGEYGGPVRPLDGDEAARFLAGREVFDRDFSIADGAGSPGFNGDSCRACHFEPVLGGAGPRGVNVMRNGSIGATGVFTSPPNGTVLPKLTSVRGAVIEPTAGTNVFEHRQTPPLFGLGLIDALPDEAIAANADPNDRDGDGISGRLAALDDGRLGKFGWKAQVPSLAEFVRDAVATELGMTLAFQHGLTFGITSDVDAAPDPEFDLAEAQLLTFFLDLLGPPPRNGNENDPVVSEGESVFEEIGCGSCHVRSLDGPTGPVELYSDLLLHDILSPGSAGIDEGAATSTEFRTPPLWGLPYSAPYLHSGAADTIEAAILAHDAEASGARRAYRALAADELDALQAFLGSL